jgi:hypothetical protein
MESLPKRANIVILAEQHNPSIVTKDWLEQKGIIKDIKEFANIPIFSMAKSEEFELIVDPNRLQLSLIKVTATNLKIMPNIILEYMKALPETPYKAVGFNYSYEIETKTRIEDILKPEKTKLSEILSKDFKMGGIIFYKFKDFLSRMNFQPINGNKIVVNFNFHFNTDNKKIIFKKLEQHVSTWVKAEKIVNGLFNV